MTFWNKSELPHVNIALQRHRSPSMVTGTASVKIYVQLSQISGSSAAMAGTNDAAEDKVTFSIREAERERK